MAGCRRPQIHSANHHTATQMVLDTFKNGQNQCVRRKMGKGFLCRENTLEEPEGTSGE